MISDGGSGISVEFKTIGVIRTPFVEAPGTPVQATYGQGIEGEVWVDEFCAPALDGIECFERIWLIYWMDRAGSFKTRVVPYRDTREYGLFATRAPNRPNPIGLSAVRLLRREGRVLHVSDIDIIDNTPLLDLKPYVPQFDAFPASRAGWLDNPGVDRRVADDRFHPRAGTGNQGRSD
jgi:tRNA-Thr(GGU) m(6)t(6)A37 methyltransferase TsaA